MENNIDVSKYGFELYEVSKSGIIFYRRKFNGYYVELMVAEDIYSLFIEMGDSQIVVANRYKIERQDELDFLLFRGRVGRRFNEQS